MLEDLGTLVWVAGIIAVIMGGMLVVMILDSGRCRSTRDDVVVASFRDSMADLKTRLGITRDQKRSLADRLYVERVDRQRNRLVMGHLADEMKRRNLGPAFAQALENAEKLADDTIREMQDAETPS